MKKIIKNEQVLVYNIIRKPIKNTYFRVKNHHIQITTSKFTNQKDIENYLEFHFERLITQLNRQQRDETCEQITLWDQTYELILTKGHFNYTISEDNVYVKAMTDDIETIKKRIFARECHLMIEQIHEEIKPILEKLKINILPYKIKYLKSKYGSYHRSHQVITINSFLARLKPVYTKYVLLHEYAHSIEFNHSSSFYKLLDQMMPEHKNIQKALKKCAIH